MAKSEAFPMFRNNRQFFERLSYEEIGKVMLYIFSELDGEEFEDELSPAADMLSAVIMDQIKRSEEAKATKREAGAAGGRAKAEKDKQDEVPQDGIANPSTSKQELALPSTVKQSLADPSKATSNQIKSNQVIPNQIKSNQEKGYCGAGPTLPPAGAQNTEAYPSLPEPTRKSDNDDTKGEVCPKDSTSEKRQEIIDYLNRRMGTSYKPDSKGIKSILDPRLKDGYTVEDCKAVIDNMIMAWGSDDKMRQYIRPSTLFRPSHIDSYLNYRQTVPRAAPVLIDDEDDDIGKYF